MLEGVPVTVYGDDAAAAERLLTVNRAVQILNVVETAITVPSTGKYAYLTYLRADCISAGTTAGVWELRPKAGSGIILNLQEAFTAAVVGTSYCWPFPVPWKTSDKGGTFTITPTANTLGTWMFICNGFYSSI